MKVVKLLFVGLSLSLLSPPAFADELVGEYECEEVQVTVGKGDVGGLPVYTIHAVSGFIGHFPVSGVANFMDGGNGHGVLQLFYDDIAPRDIHHVLFALDHLGYTFSGRACTKKS